MSTPEFHFRADRRIFTLTRAGPAEAHQRSYRFVQPVFQGQGLQELEECSVVKLAGVGGDELVHAVLPRSVSV